MTARGATKSVTWTLRNVNVRMDSGRKEQMWYICIEGQNMYIKIEYRRKDGYYVERLIIKARMK